MARIGTDGTLPGCIHINSATVGERRYAIEGRIGRGGFGAVYRARLLLDAGFEKDVALKVLHAEQANPEQLARLGDEARLLAQVRHRALPAVDGLVRLEDGRHAVVMELVEGCDLARLRRGGSLPARVALEALAEVAAALHAAYTAGPPEAPLRLVHRDVKPSNVMVTAAGDVKLLDFGIARADVVREARTATGLVVGTLAYMAPERFRGEHGPAGDVYALGCTLAAVVARLPDAPLGTLPPAVHASEVEALARAVGDVDGAPEGLGALVQELLRADPAQRPDAAEVERRLRALAAASEPPGLARWAPRALAAVPGAGAEDDPLVGSVVHERSVTTSPIDPRVAGVVGLFGLANTALAILGMGVVAAAAGWWLTRDGDVELRLVPEQVTSDPAVETFPDLSADGRRLGYVSRGRLHVVDLPGGAPAVASGALEVEAADLADDGRTAIVSASERLWQVPLDGGAPVDIGPGEAPALSPDGKRLAYVAGSEAVHVRELQTGADAVVFEGAGWVRWAADSERLVVLGRDTLLVVPLDGSAAVPLGIDALEPRWTSERLWVRYLRGPFDDLAWHAIERGSPDPRRHHAWSGSARIVQLAASLDDRRLAWTEERALYRVSVYPVLADRTLGPGRVVPISDAWAGTFHLSPDGSRIAHTSFRQGRDERGRPKVVVETLDGVADEQEGGVLSAIGGIQWLADGTLLVWDVSSSPHSLLAGESDYGGRTVVAIRPDGRWEPVATLDPETWKAALVAPDGGRGVVTDTELATGLVDLPVYRGAPPVPPGRTAEPGWIAVHWAADGSALAVVRPATGEVGVLDAETLAVTTAGKGRDAALLDRDHLLVMTHDAVRVHDLRTGEERALLDVARLETRGRARMSLSGDGRWLLVDTTEVVGDVWTAEVRQD